MLNPKSRMVIITVERGKGMVWGRAHAGNKLQTVWGSELVGVQKRKERRKWGRKDWRVSPGRGGALAGRVAGSLSPCCQSPPAHPQSRNRSRG